MEKTPAYNTLRYFARFTSSFGWLIVGLWAAIGFVAGWQWSGVLMGVLGGVTLGAALGLPFVLSGQLISVFINQKDLLEAIYEQGRLGRTTA